jgi:hypothetical protein
MMIKIVHSEFGPNSLASNFPQRPAVKKMLTILELMTTDEMEEVSRQVNAKLGWEFIKNLAEPSGAPDKPKVSKTKLAVSENRIQVVEGWASIDPAKLSISGDSVQVEPEAWMKPKAKKSGSDNPGNIRGFLQIYWKDLLIGWLTTPVGWLIYRAYRKRHPSREVVAEELTTSRKKWVIGFLLTHGLSFGFLGPAAGIPLAYRVKTRAVSVFMAINSIAVIVFFGEIISTPEGSEAATYATVIWALNLIYGFFLPVAMRMKTSDGEVETRPVFSKIETTKPTESEKIDPFDDEEYFANAQAKLQKEPKKKSWNDLRDSVTEILSHSGIEGFNIEFAQPDISGIYFQGFRDKSGCITIEAAANLSVRPEITNEQNRSIIGIGWEPPAGDNPNYIQILDLTQSNLKFIAELILTTLRDGYGVGIEGLQPVFSVSMGGEIIYVDFAEFKRLTSQ